MCNILDKIFILNTGLLDKANISFAQMCIWRRKQEMIPEKNILKLTKFF